LSSFSLSFLSCLAFLSIMPYDSSSSSTGYSNLFTAGLFSHSPAPFSSQALIPPPIITTTSDSDQARSNGVRPPSSPGKAPPSPRRRKKSSATIVSSPMSAIKSPTQRAQLAQKAKNLSTLLSSTSNAFAVSENRALMRRSRNCALPMRKPAPDAPLPLLPALSFTETNERAPYLRRDSDTLPLPSPTILHRQAPPRLGQAFPFPMYDGEMGPRMSKIEEAGMMFDQWSHLDSTSKGHHAY